MVASTPSTSLFVVVALLLAALVSTGQALQCYVCTSELLKNCGDTFGADKVPKMECTPEVVKQSVNDATQALSDVLTKFGVDVPQGTMALEFVCQKIKRTEKDGKEVVLRSCAFSPDAVNSCPPKSVEAECVHCKTDLCNGAPAQSSTGVRVLLLLLLPAAALRLLRP